MSVTYRIILNGVAAAFEEVGASFATASSAPPSRVSVKAHAGPASKVVATLVRLDVTQQGVGAERGDSKASGLLVVKLSPSKASEPVALDTLADMHDLAHRALIHLDGKNGVRISNVDSSAGPAGIQFTARLSFGMGVTADDAPNSLKGVG